jgi:hypothetical protein
MKKGKQMLTNKLNPNSESHNLNISEFEMLANLTDGNLAVAKHFAAKANAVVVPLPQVVASGDMNLLDAFLTVNIKSGSFDYAFKNYWDKGRISPTEFDKLEQLNADLISARLAFIAKIESLVSSSSK